MTIISALYIIDAAIIKRIADLSIRTVGVSVAAPRLFADTADA